MVMLENTPFCVNGSPSENALALARLSTLTMNRLPIACVPSSFWVAPASTRMPFWLPR
ncbi:hypothetical protein D3C83_31680 [compost metagenome]